MRLWDMLKAENGLPVGRAFPALWGASRQNTVATITGVPPLTFRSGGMALTDYTILGNSYQDGTPTPDDPVEVVSVGDKTENLIDTTDPTARNNMYINGNGVISSSGGWWVSGYIPIEQGERYTAKNASDRYLFYSEKGGTSTFINKDPDYGFIVPEGINYVRVWGKKNSVMLVKGSTVPSSYVPYGYKIPITVGGETQNIYLDEPLRKQLNGDTADALNYATQTLIRRVDASCAPLVTPTTESITLPTITPTPGSNTLSIDTTLQPSQVSITGHIKPVTS